MKMNRRSFISTAALAGGTAAISPLSSFGASGAGQRAYPDYSALDKALRLPVLKRDLFPSPVIMKTIELLQDRDNFI